MSKVPLLQRVAVTDAQSGVALFEKLWTWKGDSHSEGVCTLVQVFFQFAREMDSPDVSRVLFAQPEMLTGKTSARSRLTGGTGRGRTGSFSMTRDGPRQHMRMNSRIKAMASRPDPPIGMTCQRVEDVIVALFHDSTADAKNMEHICGLILTRFREKYLRILTPSLDTLRASELDGNSKMADDVIEKAVQPFKDFDVDRVILSEFPDLNLHPSPGSSVSSKNVLGSAVGSLTPPLSQSLPPRPSTAPAAVSPESSASKSSAAHPGTGAASRSASAGQSSGQAQDPGGTAPVALGVPSTVVVTGVDGSSSDGLLLDDVTLSINIHPSAPTAPDT